MTRQSIQPTYNHADSGDRFTVEYRVNDRRVSLENIPDPFVNATLRLGWRDLLRGLLRKRLSVTVVVGGDQAVIEDVLELDDDYKGEPGSTRREEWDRQFQGALCNFAARAGEHDIS